jgi:hypothetical protein
MRDFVIALGALTLVACSGGSEPPPTVAPEPPQASAVPAPSEVPPTSVAPPETSAPAVDSGVPPVVLSATTSAEGVRGLYVAELDFPYADHFHVAYPDPAIGARIDALLEDAADQHRGDGVTCSPLSATQALVSITCSGSFWPDDRSDSLFTDASIYQVEIAGDDVHPTSVEDAIVLGPEIDALLIDALDDAFARSAPSDEISADAYQLAATGLSADGLHAFWANSSRYGGLLEADIPYDRMVDRIRADGPVARMLHLGEFADPEPPTDAPASQRGPWTVGAVMPLGEAAARWNALPASLRGALSFHPSPGTARFAIRAAVGIDTAHAAANALGQPLVPDASDAPWDDFVIARANASVNLRATDGSGARWIAALPRGATVTVVTLADHVFYGSDWVQVVAAPGLTGWSAARFLDVERCAIDPTDALAALPADVREQAAGSMLRMRTTVLEGGHSIDAALFLAPAGDHTYVALRRYASATCTVGAPISSWTIDGRGVDALVTRTTRRTGETLVLVQTEQGRTSTCLALRRGTDAPVWQLAGLAHPSSANVVHAPAMIGPSGHGFWPLSIVRRGQPIVTYRWDGTTLVNAEP